MKIKTILKDFFKPLANETGVLPAALAAPGVLSALITSGASLAGGGVAGIGAGMSAAKQAEAQRLKDEQDRAEREKMNRQNMMMSQQQSGMQGIQMLAALQSQAANQFKGQRFGKALAGVLKGGV